MITGQPYSRATNHNFTTTGNPADVGSTATDPDVTDVGTALSFFQNDGSFNQATSATAVVSGSGFTQALYLQEAGDITAISVDDLHQGQIGDCFLLSSIGELALRYMGAISDMIHANGDGTETVRLYAAADGQVPTHGTSAYKAVSINVDNSFPSYSVNEAATQDVVGGKKEIWPQVIEKAMAIEDGGYDAIAHGGWPVIAMEVLTGHGASSVAPADLTLAVLQSEITAGGLIVMDTPSGSNLPF